MSSVCSSEAGSTYSMFMAAHIGALNENDYYSIITLFVCVCVCVCVCDFPRSCRKMCSQLTNDFLCSSQVDLVFCPS